MRRILQRVLSSLIGAAGALPALYGLFAILYNDVGGDTYVKLAGRKIDADLVGAIALAFGGLSILASTLVWRRR